MNPPTVLTRLGCHKADPLQPFNLFHTAQKFCKTDRMFQIFSIGVDILSKKHDFHYAVFYQSFNLVKTESDFSKSQRI